MKASFCRIAFALAVVATAGAPSISPAQQTNKQRVAGGAYDRPHDYDLVHQRIEISGFDWDSASFSGRVATTLVGRRAGMDSVVLDAGHLLNIHSVVDAAGRPLRFGTHGDSLVIHTARPLANGDTMRFTVDYDGRVRGGKGLTFIQPEGRAHRPRQIWSQGEAMDNHNWFPTYDFPNDKTTWEVLATVPANFTAVSNGRLVDDVRHADGTHTAHWSMERPNSTYLVSLVVAPLAKVHDTWRGRPVDYYVYREDSARAWRLFHETPDMIEVYSRLTGVPYPWSKYAQTTVADFFGGMENVSATTLVDWLPDARAYADRPWYQHILIPHELAHQWFGDYVTTRDWSHTWLNEGFAEFMPGQYWAERLGRDGEDDYYADEYVSFLRIDVRKRTPLAALGSNNIYPRGALVLKMLKDYLGPQRFWASIHRYLTEHALGTATSEDLRAAIQRETGEDLGWFFDEWVYQAGYPEFTVTQTYDPAARRLTLHVAQTQQDTSRADSTGLRFTTPLVYRMPVTVQVGTAAGDVSRRFEVNQREQTLTIADVGAPTMVVFDWGNHVLKRLRFDQPTAWLAEQLRRDPALWNRQWAIAQLATRHPDPEAFRALAEAAAHAADVRTRADAASTMGVFTPDQAIPVLEAAMRDTSARVRLAAVQAAGRLRGARAAALARAAFDRDTSYSVRAAAIATVARADSLGSADLIRRGLAVESYRNAVRNAALDAVAETGDTTFIPKVDVYVGQEENAVWTLGGLAVRGSAHALDVLVGHLNDPRRYVREWTVSVFQELPSAVAAQALRAAEPSLRYPETREAVQHILAAPPSGDGD